MLNSTTLVKKSQSQCSVRKLTMALAVSAAYYQMPVMAQGYELEEIIITAQKRTESLQDVAATVNAVSGEILADFEVRDFKDIETLTAGLTLAPVDARASSVSLRGISYDPDGSLSAAVDLYKNGVALSSYVAFRQMFDVQSIEVLRGPQGTFQGRTSPAGSIHVNTTTPNLDAIDGYVQATVFENDGLNTQFGVSLPIIEGQLGLRIAGVYDENGGQGLYNFATGDEESASTDAVRVSLAWEPTDTFSATLIHEYLEEDNEAWEAVEGSDTPGNGNPVLSYKDRSSLADGYADGRDNLTSLIMEYTVAGHKITSVTGYQDIDFFSTRDLDLGNAVPLNLQQTVVSDYDIFTQELRIQSEDSTNWEYLVGLYYENTQTNTVVPNGAVLDFFGNLTTSETETVGPADLQYYGVFANNKFYIGEASTLQVGLRWQKVKVFNRVDTSIPGVGVLTLVPEELVSSSSTAFTGGIKYTYDLTNDVMVYGSLDRSYRPGGANIALFPLGPADIIFDEETSDGIEFGFKSTLWGGRAQANGAIFYQQFDDFITRANDITGDFDGDGVAETYMTGLTYNADATIQGAELEITGLITEHWKAFFGMSYVDAKFDDDARSLCNGPLAPGQQIARCDASGQRIGSEPNWSISASSEFSIPIGDFDWFVRGLYKFTGSRTNTLVDSADVGGYGLIDLFTGLRGKSWELTLWTKNITDKEARTRISAESFVSVVEPLVPGGGYNVNSGYNRVGLVPERTVGLTAMYSF
ncbi:TonB-dependent receptor [Pseudomaricurvus alkylphenolicus]|uniref:TonB-dependent receptor n=1 Tax=Pseudomaricurvus alkylphenolicus TaxID=1306991 RepID=UPI00141D85D0|nr:TonB-dependent receptor [Pseudomaricurvus alkylphenolicus]NIB45168.1 TonB-dependent receptor [Pseudomaricurvus alkylphenolicus]